MILTGKMGRGRLFAAGLVLVAAFAQADGTLKPGQVITLTFPELQPTLVAQAKGSAAPAMLTARLPDNYTLAALRFRGWRLGLEG